MFDLNPHALLQMAKSKQKELLSQAELARLCRQTRISRPWLRRLSARSFGGSLIALGQRLQAREKPVL